MLSAIYLGKMEQLLTSTTLLVNNKCPLTVLSSFSALMVGPHAQTSKRTIINWLLLTHLGMKVGKYANLHI